MIELQLRQRPPRGYDTLQGGSPSLDDEADEFDVGEGGAPLLRSSRTAIIRKEPSAKLVAGFWFSLSGFVFLLFISLVYLLPDSVYLKTTSFTTKTKPQLAAGTLGAAFTYLAMAAVCGYGIYKSSWQTEQIVDD